MMPRYHVSVQAGFLDTVANPCPPSITPDIYTISGSPLRCLESDTHAQFIAWTQAQVESRIINNLENNGITDRLTTTKHFTLDMEAPTVADGGDGYAHPNDLHLAPTDVIKGQIIAAWKTRIAAARAVMPFAKLSMYGTIVPDGDGDETDATYLARLAALIQAGTVAGYNGVGALYDGLDYLAPVLYPRFGPDDGVHWGTQPASTRQGIDGARQLLKSDGSSLPLLAYVTNRVHNGNSAHNDDLLLDFDLPMGLHSTLLNQFSVLAGRNVEDIAFWVGANDVNVGILPAPNAGNWTLHDFLVRIMPTTTVSTIRDQMVSVLEGLTPTSHAGVKFRGHRDEMEFFEWCGTNKAASLRRIEVRGGTSFEPPEVTNTDVEFHRTPMTVTVAYPLEWGKYGPKNRASLEKLIEQDMHQIDDSIGARGQANWTGGSWAMKVRDEVAEQDGVLFMRMEFQVGYYRSV